jgi:omega-3 fatty acid desaturase (delta-15 desaturase)
MYHNHLEKDYSHPWYTPERFEREDEGLARMFHSNIWMLVTFPLYGWAIYLYGLPDGSHYIPFETQRMWKDTPKAEYFKCLLSSSVVLAFLAGIYLYCGSLSKMAYYYGVPYFVYGWWLFTVTYLQHHNPETVAYPGASTLLASMSACCVSQGVM